MRAHIKTGTTKLIVCFIGYFARTSKNDVPRNFKVISEEGKLSTK